MENGKVTWQESEDGIAGVGLKMPFICFVQVQSVTVSKIAQVLFIKVNMLKMLVKNKNKM